VHPLLWLVPYGTQAFPKGVSWSCSFVIRDSSNKVRYFIETTKKIDEILQLKIALLEAYHSTIFDRTVIVLEKKYRTLFLESTPDKITVNCLEEYFKSIPKYSVL
jgi:hypothetical protein